MVKRKKLTKRQSEIIDYLEDYIIEHGYSPTIIEISEHFEISPTSASHHIQALERKKQVSRTPGVARSIVVERLDSLKVPLFKVDTYLSGESEYVICVPGSLVDEYKSFVLEMNDSRLIGAGITEGDLLVVGKVDSLDIGEFGVIRFENSLVLGQFFCEDEHIRLEPNNPMYEPIILYPKEQDVEVIGKFIALYRKF